MTICLVTDLISRKIYNLVILPAFLFGILYHFISAGWSGLYFSLLGTVTGLFLLIVPFALGYMGAGDVKLLAVIGTIKGYIFVLYTAVGMSLAGGIIAVLIMVYQRRFFSTLVLYLRAIIIMITSGFRVIDFSFDHERTMFPYALAIVAGAVGTMWWVR